MKKISIDAQISIMVTCYVADILVDDPKDPRVTRILDSDAHPATKDAVRKGLRFAEGLGVFDQS